MIPIDPALNLPTDARFLLLDEIREDNLAVARVVEADAVVQAVGKVDGLFLFPFGVGAVEVVAAVHVPYYGHLAQGVPERWVGEVFGWLEEVGFAHWY